MNLTAEAALTLVREYAREPGVNQSMIATMVEDLIEKIQIADLQYKVDVIVINDFDEIEHIEINSNYMRMYTNRILSMVRIFMNYDVQNVYITQKAMEQNEDINLITTKLKLDGKAYQTIG